MGDEDEWFEKGRTAMTVFKALILGAVQGLTEFFPVSSSGHLVLFGTILGVREASLTFDVLVHVGTLLAVIIALWADVKGLFAAVFKVLVCATEGKSGLRRLWQEDPYVRLLLLLVLASIPVGVVGLLWEEQIAHLFTSVPLVGINLLITGTMLWYASRVGEERRKVRREAKQQGKQAVKEPNLRQAITVGIAQVAALAPGISRSGTTISAGLFAGLSRDMATRFSFLLSLPAIAGAAVLQIPELVGGIVKFSIAVTGFVSAAVSGYLAIKLLLRLVRSGQLYIFAYYTWGLGILVLLLSCL